MRVVRVRPEPQMVRLASQYADARFSYPEVGATESHEVPEGYERIDYSWQIGIGAALFESAANDLLVWFMHSIARTHPISSAASAEPGSNVLLQFRMLGVAVLAPCRVVWTRSVGNERGFAYGTLRDHPEIGEEAFVVSLGENEEVTFRVYGFSKPAPGLPQRVRPLTRRLQARVIHRYRRALIRAK